MGRGTGIDAQQSRIDEEKCVPVRGRIKEEDIVATVHGDDITIGGDRSAVGFLIKMISRRYEIKKQVIGEIQTEKSGRILNRVIEWNRDGITIEADHRHDREASNWNERITLLWTGRMRTAEEMMKARERVDVDGGRPRPSTSGTDRR